jgi:ribosome-binding protein aMBF1 (putative translation factor)
MDHQDWEPVVWNKKNKKKVTASNGNSTSSTNRSHTRTRLHKLENGETVRTTTSHIFRTALQKARTHKQLSQQMLAKQCNIPTNLLQGFEKGTSIPSVQVRQRLNRVLETTLPKY